MRHTRLLILLCAFVVAIGLAGLILFHPSGQRFFPPLLDNVVDKDNQPNSVYRQAPSNKKERVSATGDNTADVNDTAQKQNNTQTTTRITDEGAKQTTTVTYKDGITTTTTVTEYPDGLVGTHKEMVPDKEGMPTPWDLSIEEEVELAEQWLAHYDDDPNVVGVSKDRNGNFIPLYENTIYITRSERQTKKGNVVYTGKGYKGIYDFNPATEPVPAGMRVIELDKEGNTLADYISNGDPWQYILARGLDPIVYFYGEETAEFMAEYFNVTDAVPSQGRLPGADGQDVDFAPDADTLVKQEPILSASESASEKVAPRQQPSPDLLQRIQERGFEQFEDVVKRLQETDPEMAWRKRYLPDIPTPKEPEETIREHSGAMGGQTDDEDFLK